VSLHELFDTVFRWAHLIAGIMWVGNSMLFNWLDRNLVKTAELPRLSQGKIFMVHSGAFYDVEKKLLAPGELPSAPEQLHWFKWQNGFTWMTGISLLVIVYYMNGASLLIDQRVRDLAPVVAVTLSIGSIFTGWLIYDGLWRSIGERSPRLATVLSIAGLFGSVYAYAQVFAGPAAYIHAGVLMGTIMTGNVWMCIMPSQRSLIAATKSGAEQDATLSLRAKQRSIHNNYLTFPLLFIMLSNHFPAATGSAHNWLILILVMIGGAGVRHFMNVRYLGGGKQRPAAQWLLPAFACAAIAIAAFLIIPRFDFHPGATTVDYKVDFERAQAIIGKRCVPCHSSHPSGGWYDVAPRNIMFDTSAEIGEKAPRILELAVKTQTMPYLNKTGMTDEERAELGRWLADGAKLK
jgi:uncharacterized membrane protein